MKTKRILSLLAIASLTATLFVGCGTKAESALKDGTYTAHTEADNNGYSSSIEITVADGKISAVKFDEKDSEGTSKLDMPDYNEQMLSISGSNPIAAYPTLEESLIKTQNVDAVDTVTGATSTSDTFKALATEALESAK